MKQFGDITKINGAQVPSVDIITGGSPCQDLSIAGKRAGLAGKRSGLFMEQVRVIKEMRTHDRVANRRTDEHIRPRYMVWENVPGALSSNGGEDFRAVLEETAKIADKTAIIPRPPEGKWQPAGCILGDGWSIAWRVHDAQFWGVPQRRRRIALVADFGGESAPEILFERESVSGDIKPGAAEGKEAAGTVGNGAKKASGFNGWKSVSGDIQYQEDKCPTIERNMPPNVIVESSLLENNQNHAIIQGVDVYNGQLTGEVAATITAACGSTNTSGAKVFCLQGNGIDRADTAGCNGKGWREDVSYTLNTIDRHAVCDMGCQSASVYSFDSLASNSMKSKNPNSGCRKVEVSKTLDCFDPNPSKNQGGIAIVQKVGNKAVIGKKTMVRRLTPLECERLQGYQDGYTDIGEWTDSKGKRHKDADTPRYKALGNSIALPFWEWMAKRICAQYDRKATMASLFDGIGGFPLVFSNCGAEPVWCSEVDEFCTEVTRRHFPEEER